MRWCSDSPGMEIAKVPWNLRIEFCFRQAQHESLLMIMLGSRDSQDQMDRIKDAKLYGIRRTNKTALTNLQSQQHFVYPPSQHRKNGWKLNISPTDNSLQELDYLHSLSCRIPHRTLRPNTPTRPSLTRPNPSRLHLDKYVILRPHSGRTTGVSLLSKKRDTHTQQSISISIYNEKRMKTNSKLKNVANTNEQSCASFLQRKSAFP